MKKIFSVLFWLMPVTVCAQNKAVDRLKQAIKVAKENPAKVDLLHDLSYKYMWSAADSATIYARQCRQLAQKINDIAGIGYSLVALCDASTELGNYPQAVDYGFKAVSIFKKSNDTPGIIRANSSIALCYRNQGNYKASLTYVHDALNLAAQLDVHKAILPVMWGIICSVYEKNNQLDSALFYAKKSGEYWSGVLYVFGSIYAKKGNYELALRYYKRTITAAEKNNTLVAIVDAYNGISGVYIDEGQTDSAIYYAKKALVKKPGRTYELGAMESAALLANIFEKEKISDSTLKYLKLTIGIKDSLYSRQKEREVQNIAFNEQLNEQELQKQKEQAETRLKMFALMALLCGLLVIAVLQWRNNSHRQRAFNLLQSQKQETDLQKAKAEHALAELRCTQTQLIQSEKMASMGELTAGIAHEIQNPLNFVNNFSEVNKEILLALETSIKNRNTADALGLTNNIIQNEEKINNHGKRADAIVKGMLKHFRTRGGQKEPTNINTLADEYMRHSYHGLRTKDKTFNAELTTHFDPHLPKINVIPQDMGRVFLNLFNNAFYAVYQKAKAVGLDFKPQVTVSTYTANGKVIITIKDNGIGIPDEIKDKIMQPFFSTKPTGEGTGLGLSLTHDMVVKGHGGSIQFYSVAGEGSKFIISLPDNVNLR
jgi:signal transduction histidine kinase